MWGDVGRRGETWGDVGRRGETWGDVGRSMGYRGEWRTSRSSSTLDGRCLGGGQCSSRLAITTGLLLPSDSANGTTCCVHSRLIVTFFFMLQRSDWLNATKAKSLLNTD
eukprot:scaffold82330_cov54-Phaeocystis_antarctica.AAC.2